MSVDLKKIETIENPSQRGNAYLEAKQYEKAATAFLEAIKNDSGDVSLGIRLGQAYMGAESYTKARQIFQEVIRVNPETAEVKNFLEKLSGEEERRRGDEEFKRKDFQKAIENFRHSIRLNPDNTKSKLALLAAFLELGNLDKPIEVVESMHGVEPDDLDEFIVLINRLAIRLRKEGRFEDAIGVYGIALEADQEDAALFFNLAMCYAKKNKIGNAKMNLRKALELDPDFKEAHDLMEKLSK